MNTQNERISHPSFFQVVQSNEPASCKGVNEGLNGR